MRLYKKLQRAPFRKFLGSFASFGINWLSVCDRNYSEENLPKGKQIQLSFGNDDSTEKYMAEISFADAEDLAKQLLANVRPELVGPLTQFFEANKVFTPKDGKETVELLKNSIGKLNYQGNQKIMAIKALRELSVAERWYSHFGSVTPMRLADAKYAVENFDAFCGFIVLNNRLPIHVFGGCAGNDKNFA